jgi:hypothetical protein
VSAGRRCTGKTVMVTDARGMVSEGELMLCKFGADGYVQDIKGKVDDELVVKIAAVYCGDRDADVDATRSKRGDDTQLLAPPSLGNITICQVNGNGVCETLVAQDECVPFSEEFSHNIRKIHQDARLYCKYYDSSCDRISPILTFDSRDKAKDLKLPQELWNSLGSVRCRSRFWADDAGDQAAAVVESRTDAIVAKYPGQARLCYQRPSGGQDCWLPRAHANCIAMVGGWYKGVDFIAPQFAGAVCYYYSTPNCRPDTMFMYIDTTDGDRYPYLGFDRELGHQIAGMQCRITGPGDKRSLAGGPHTFKGLHAPAAAPLSPRVEKAQAPGDYRGHIMFCKNEYSCSNVFALNACQTFSRPFHHSLDSVWQDQGAVCKYFRWDCSEVTPVVTVDTREGNYNGNLDGFGHDIGQVLCRSGDWGVKDRGELRITANATASVPAPKKHDTIEVASRTVIRDDAASESVSDMVPRPGDVNACHAERHQGNCDYVNAMHVCIAFTEGRAWNFTRSIIQYQGALCTYYSGEHDCSGEVMIAASPNEDMYLPIVDPYVANYLTHVKCEPYGSKEAAFVHTINDHGDIAPQQEDTKAKRDIDDTTTGTVSGTLARPGDVKACSSADFQGNCDYFNAMNSCVALSKSGAWKNIQSLVQYAGAACEYYEGDSGCPDGTARLGIGAPREDYKIPNLDINLTEITHVQCKPYGKMEHAIVRFMSPSSLPVGEKRLIPGISTNSVNDDPKPGHVGVCTEDYFNGYCGGFDTLDKCTALSQEDGTWKSVHSFYQNQGATCFYYSNEHGCSDVQLRIDSPLWDFEWEMVPDALANSMTHVRCTTYIDDAASRRVSRDDTPSTSAYDKPSRPGDVKVCSLPDFQGNCEYVNAMDTCTAFSQDGASGNVQSLVQYAGALCNYIEGGSGCPFNNTRFGYWDPDSDIEVPNLYGPFGKITHVQCQVYKPPPAHDCLKVCPEVDLGGNCLPIKESSCANNPFSNDPVKSLDLDYGYRCAMFPVADCNKSNGEPEYVDATLSPVQIAIVTYDIGSMFCRFVGQFNETSTIDARGGSEALQVSVTEKRHASNAASTSVNARDYLKICPEVNMGGDCLLYSEISCGSNPFGNNPIKSFRLESGYRCVLWPAADCKSGNGEPEYIDASSFPVQVDDVTYDVRSIHCSVIGLQVDETSAVVARGDTKEEMLGKTMAEFEKAGHLTTSDEILFCPLNAYSEVNLTGTSYTYEGPGCQNLPTNIEAVRSLTLKKGFICAVSEERDCEFYLFPWKFIHSTSAPFQNNDFDYAIKSMACTESIEDGPPGDITSCDAPNFENCTDVKVNAMGRCVNLHSTVGGPASLRQSPTAWCYWYHERDCLDQTMPMMVVSASNTTEMVDMKSASNQYNSVECRDELWYRPEGSR